MKRAKKTAVKGSTRKAEQDEAELERLSSVSRFLPPPLSGDIIPRPSLMELLAGNRNKKVIALAAPAGFGKSTLLAQWHASCQREKPPVTCLWINLKEADADPNIFLPTLIRALVRAGIEVGEIAILPEHGLLGASPKAVVEKVSTALQAHGAPVAVFLDDFHLAHSPSLNDLLATLVLSGPPVFKLYLSTRDKLVNDLFPLLVSGDAIEIDANALRFSEQEVREAIAVELPPESLAELIRRVEGWPVAVQLAKLLLTGENRAAEAVTRLHGHTGPLAVYLTEEVVGQLDSRLQEFLLKTSILKDFTIELADHVCGHDRSRALLKKLQPLYALLIPLDDSNRQFRYHNLFAECLEDLLHDRYGAETAALHRRASEWYRMQGQITEAVRHAVAAKDHDLAAQLICEAGGWELILFGGIGYLTNLMRYIPPNVMQAHPRLLFANSYLALKNGDIRSARAQFDAAVASKAYDEDDKEMQRDYINLRVLLESYEDEWIIKKDNNYLYEKLQEIPADDPVTRGIIHCIAAMRETGFGQFEKAVESTRLAARSMREGNTVLGLNYVYLHVGMCALYTGDYAVAEANFDKASAMAEDNFGADSGLKYLADVYRDAVAFWRGRLDDSGLQRLQAGLEHVQDFDGWFDIFAVGYDALFHAAVNKQDFEAAARVVDMMEETAADRGITRLACMAAAFRLMQLTWSGDKIQSTMKLTEVKALASPRTATDPASTWMVRFFTAAARARYATFMGKHQDAMAAAGQCVEIASSIKAGFFLLRARILKAVACDFAKKKKEAVDTLVAALKTGAASDLREPFCYPHTGRLLRAARSRIRNMDEDILTANFVTGILGQAGGEPGLLSDRETEVIEELAQGRLNKEIAFTLNMTENTVKFHLKNIFAKLGVTRRMQAITKAKDLKIIE